MRRNSALTVLSLGLALLVLACSPQGSPPPAATGQPAKSGTSPASAATQPASAAAGAQKARVTALEAFRLIEPEVRKWNQGARIALGGPSATSKDFDLFDGKSSAWRFVCATADGETFRSFTVNTSGDKPKITAGDVSNRPAVTALTDPATWRIDSPKVYEIATANGLKEWLAEHPTFTGKDEIMTLELRGLQEIGSYWLLTCHKDKKTIEFQISATDGKVYHVRSH